MDSCAGPAPDAPTMRWLQAGVPTVLHVPMKKFAFAIMNLRGVPINGERRPSVSVIITDNHRVITVSTFEGQLYVNGEYQPDGVIITDNHRIALLDQSFTIEYEGDGDEGTADVEVVGDGDYFLAGSASETLS